MTRLVIQDYFAIFRWRNIKEKYNKGILWMFLYFLTGIPAVTGAFESGKQALTYMYVMIPFFFCMAVEPLQSTLMPKMMYLCPISQEARREYIVKSCYVRIMVPIIVGALGVAGLLLSGIGDWICGMGVLLNITTISICMGANLYINGTGKIAQNGAISPNAGLLEIFIIIVTMITALLYADWMQGISDMVWLKWGFIGGEIIVQVPMVVSYLKKWRGATERALIYEGSGILQKEQQRTGR